MGLTTEEARKVCKKKMIERGRVDFIVIGGEPGEDVLRVVTQLETSS